MEQQFEPVTPEAVREWMVDYLKTILDLPSDFSTSMKFASYGIDSVEAVIMAGVMELEFGITMEPHFFFNEPSIEGVISELLKYELIVKE